MTAPTRNKRLTIRPTDPFESTEDTEGLPPLPASRNACRDTARPCTFLRCAHHLALEVNHVGSVMVADDVDLAAMSETCALDVADRGGAELKEIADALDVKWQSVQKVEESAKRKIRRNPTAARIFAAYLEERARRPAPTPGADTLTYGEAKELRAAIDRHVAKRANLLEAAE